MDSVVENGIVIICTVKLKLVVYINKEIII